MIPHILHQTGPDVLPQWTQDYIVTLKHWHPNWQYRFWSDSDLYSLVQTDYSWLLPEYNRCSKIGRSDLGRYCILHKHGGVYIDTDMFFLAALDQVIQRAPHGLWLAFSAPTWPAGKAMLTNYIMASPPGHPFWLDVLQEASRRIQSNARPWWAFVKSMTVPYRTGRNVITKVALGEDSVNMFEKPEILNLHCSHTPVTMACVAVHNGGTARTFESSNWNTLNKIVNCECKIQKVLGIPSYAFQFPICILLGVILVVMVVIGVTFVCIHYVKRLSYIKMKK